MAAQKEAGLTPSFELLKSSINIIKEHLEVYVLIYIAPFLVAFVGGLFSALDLGALGGLLIFAGVLLSLVLYPALIYTQLQTSRGKKVTVQEAIEHGLKYFWRVIGAAILIGIIVTIGLILFIVPGVILLRRYLLTPYYIVDRNMNISKAMETSAAESKPYSGSVYGIIGINILFGVLSIIPILGQLISAILQLLYSVAPALRYNEFKQLHKA